MMRRLLIGVMVLLTAGVLGVLLPTQAQGGGNWFGQFYNNTTLDQSGFVTIAQYPSGLNVNWGTGAPTDGFGVVVPGVNADSFSARFTTTVEFVAGLYEFVIQVDDGVRFFIDGQPIIDAFAESGFTTETAIVSLQGGPHTLTVEYVEFTGAAALSVNWFASTGTPQPTPTQAPVATGTVENVRGLAVRTGPYLGASLIGVARPENTYPVLARNDNEGLFTWYKIVLDEQTVGWSSGRYLAVEGDINALPFEDSVFETLDTLGNTGIRGVSRAIMNFRPRPSVRVPRMGQLPWGAEFEIIARTVQGGQNFWFLVRYRPESLATTEPAQVGWIFAPYITVRGPIEAVPVY